MTIFIKCQLFVQASFFVIIFEYFCYFRKNIDTLRFCVYAIRMTVEGISD